jgi:hypothetical protein
VSRVRKEVLWYSQVKIFAYFANSEIGPAQLPFFDVHYTLES